MESERSWRWSVLLAAIVVLPPVVVRLMLAIDLELGFESGDLFGLTADLAVSLALAAGLGLLVGMRPWGRWLAMVILAVWCLLNFANSEHIRELGSTVVAAHAAYLVDATFFLGSVLAPTRPLVLVVVVVGTCGALWWLSTRTRDVAVRWLLVAATLLLVVAWIRPPDHRLATWRQTNFVLEQVNRLKDRGEAGGAGRVALVRAVEPELDGDLFVDALPRGTNVLLVILEGVSGAYLSSVRARHGVPGSLDMPELDRIARRGLVWSTFINHQRQTNRGEYALLCGDYPKLVTAEPKMTELAGSARLDCLPSVLGQAGYLPVYLQAAPMAFMVKDQFMPAAGFERSEGATSFDWSYHRNQWGIDDRAFFEHGTAAIEELRRGERPWFLTLLTVGTHHPFNAPPDFEGGAPAGSAAWAMEYLDQAVGAFVDRLEALGVLEDTLVLITSDESRELVAGDSDLANSLRQAWGVLIALHPHGAAGVVDEPAMQLDLPISVVDALDLDARAAGFGGRSVFRHYDASRRLLWGNTHLGLVGGVSAEGHLAVCTEDLGSCVGRDGVDSVFSPDQVFLPVDPSTLSWLVGGVEESLSISLPNPAQRELALVDAASIPIATDLAEQLVFGGQFFSVPPGVRADVDVVVRLTGAEGQVRYHHDFIIGRRQEYLRSGRLRVGERLTIRYSVAAGFELSDLESRFWIDEIDGRGLALEFSQARVRLAPATGGSVETGIVERAHAVD